MRLDTEPSTFDLFVESLGMIWNPGLEALKLKQAFDIQSLADIQSAALRAGCEIYNVDLPARVSGFSLVVNDKRLIVINRDNPSLHRDYTVAHELAHQILHLNPSHSFVLPQIMTNDLQEFQANMFATALVVWTANDQEREVMGRQNPELHFTPLAALLLTLAAILIAFVVHVSPLFQRQLPASTESK
jgi:Zn-dependent peptidase ImmA (M78 family)